MTVSISPSPPVPWSPARSLIPVIHMDLDILLLFGVEGVAVLLAEGLTYTQIAHRIGVSPGSLNSWLYNLPDEPQAMISAALKISAEMLMDKADEILDEPGAELLSGPEVTLRVARADSRRKRAAQRNASYGTKPEAAPASVPIPNNVVYLNVVLPKPETVARYKAVIDGTPVIEPTMIDGG